tara:strand:+ start:530 stop:733 length:204 start_codon:yes stop_codon:yes gene_type:complete
MNNADMPAMPIPRGVYNDDTAGLTKREHFAGLAMQGLLAHYGDSYNHYLAAVEFADALLKALEQDNE